MLDKATVERNRRLVRLEKYGAPLKDRNQVEPVTLVGDGAM